MPLDRALDRALGVAAHRVREPTGLVVTERQLYYEVCRVLRPVHLAPARPRFTVPAPVGVAAFRALLADRATVPGLLDDRPAPPRPGHRAWSAPEDDVLDYGLPRLLVVQDQPIAAMLRANHWYLDAACPVYSLAELATLPGRDAVAAAVRSVSGTAYLLHGSGAAGAAVPGTAARLLGPDVRVRPLGLRPAQAGALHLTVVPDGGDGCEPAAIPPARLLRGLHRMVGGTVTTTPGPWRAWRRAARAGYLDRPEAS
jgi:hypothetical protein